MKKYKQQKLAALVEQAHKELLLVDNIYRKLGVTPPCDYFDNEGNMPIFRDKISADFYEELHREPRKIMRKYFTLKNVKLAASMLPKEQYCDVSKEDLGCAYWEEEYTAQQRMWLDRLKGEVIPF